MRSIPSICKEKEFESRTKTSDDSAVKVERERRQDRGDGKTKSGTRSFLSSSSQQRAKKESGGDVQRNRCATKAALWIETVDSSTDGARNAGP